MVMQRFLEIANGIPRLVIVTLLLLVLQPGMLTIIFALMLTEWVGMSRIARAEMLKLKEQEFVLASRTLGAGSFFIIFKEVLPNIIVNDGGCHRNDQGYSRSGPGTCPDVTSEIVTAEPVLHICQSLVRVIVHRLGKCLFFIIAYILLTVIHPIFF